MCTISDAVFDESLLEFRGAVRKWCEQASGRGRAAELGWTVIAAADHLDRMLMPATVDVVWWRSLCGGVRELFQAAPPPLDLTSKPVLVREIWGQYGRQKKSWVMSAALQSAAVAVVFTAAVTPVVRRTAVAPVTLVAPVDAPDEMKAPHVSDPRAGGGGGDRSLLSASIGRLPKASLRPFTPPEAVVANLDPKLSMEPSIFAPPDVALPQVNLPDYGDPLGRIGGPKSNGPGSGGGIGTGDRGGVGGGWESGYGIDGHGGVRGGIFRAGEGGVSAPGLLYKVEPEYSEEARKAKYQGTVMLYVEVDASGRAQNMLVLHSLGLGLDEKAMEAVAKWRFRPAMKDGKAVTVAATIEVNFRLL